MKEKLSLLTELIKLAKVDKNIRQEEYQFILAIANSLGISEFKVNTLFDEYIEFTPPKFEFDRILQFQRLILVANIDREFDKEENEFLKLIGLKMGLHPDAIESVLIEMRQRENGLIPPDVLTRIFQTYHN